MRITLLCLAMLATSCSCTTVRQQRAPETIPVDQPAQKTRDEHSLDYSVAKTINAPPDAVWKVLTDAPRYLSWNTTIVKLDGAIAQGEKIALVSKDAPERTFELKVTTFDPPKRLVWEDGGGMFLGVRTFTLSPAGDGSKTTLVMSETLSGAMLGMIEGDLPDFRNSFDAFVHDLAKAVEGG